MVVPVVLGVTASDPVLDRVAVPGSARVFAEMVMAPPDELKTDLVSAIVMVSPVSETAPV